MAVGKRIMTARLRYMEHRQLFLSGVPIVSKSTGELNKIGFNDGSRSKLLAPEDGMGSFDLRTPLRALGNICDSYPSRIVEEFQRQELRY